MPARHFDGNRTFITPSFILGKRITTIVNKHAPKFHVMEWDDHHLQVDKGPHEPILELWWLRDVIRVGYGHPGWREHREYDPLNEKEWKNLFKDITSFLKEMGADLFSPAHNE